MRKGKRKARVKGFQPIHLSPEELTATTCEPILRAEQRVVLARITEIAAKAEAETARRRREEAEEFLAALAAEFPTSATHPEAQP